MYFYVTHPNRLCTDSVTTSNTDDVREMTSTHLCTDGLSKDMHIPINNMPFQLFCQKLIRHFNIAFQNNEVEWPRRLPKKYHPDKKNNKEKNNKDS